MNAAHGQNGFLSAALIGGGLLAMDRRPVLAGVLLGAMAFKPHLALVIPLALVFARRWTTLIVSAVTAAAFSAASLAAFGAPAWSGFFANARLARSALENNLVGDEKMQSVFAAVRLLHGPLALSWGAQIAAAFCVVAALWRLERRAFRTSGGSFRHRLRRLARKPVRARLRSDADRHAAGLARRRRSSTGFRHGRAFCHMKRR